MNYSLSVANRTYPIQDIQTPLASRLTEGPVGKPFRFISPIPLAPGQCCVLRGDSGGYQLQVKACFGFTSMPQFLVSGMINVLQDRLPQDRLDFS